MLRLHRRCDPVLLSLPVAAELNGRRRLFQMLQESESRYRAIAEHSGDVVLNISMEGVIEYASPTGVVWDSQTKSPPSADL